MVKILSCDLLPADVMVPLYYRTQENIKALEKLHPKTKGQYLDVESLEEPQRSRYKKLNAVLDKILREHHVPWGEKLAIDQQEFIELSEAMDDITPSGVEPGGTASNILSTLIKLLGPDHASVDFMGIKGESGVHSHIIERGIQEGRFNLIPETLPDSPMPESAISFIFNGPEGKTALTYPGNARDILKPEMITDELIRRNDTVCILGSIWGKFDFDLPNKILMESHRLRKEIWLVLPTQAKIPIRALAYRTIAPLADVVLANDKELMRVYPEAKDFTDACRILQKAFAKRKKDIEDLGLSKVGLSKEPPVAFITCSGRPALIITADEIIEVPVVPLPPDRPSYFVGAGDNAFAGFLAGHIAGLTLQESAELGMELAAAKIKYDSARIPEPNRNIGPCLASAPLHELATGSHRARILLQKLQAGLAAQQSHSVPPPAAR